MAYEIRIKGHKEPIVVDKNSDKIKADWESYQDTKQDMVIEINGWTGRLSSIIDFQTVKTSQAEKEPSRAHEEYLADRKKILDMPIEERAKNMGWFRLVYWPFTGKHSEDIYIKEIPLEKLIEEEQIKFFTENPNSIHCDISIFKKYIKSQKSNSFSINTIEQIIRQENFAKNYLN